MPSYRELLNGVVYTGAPPEGMAAGVAQDSRRVVPGGVFVCIVGRGFDGHDFAAAAVAAGAGMVVAQRTLGLACEVLVQDTRAIYGVICQNYFGRPAEKMTLIGVTGTNGKTTVSTVLKQALTAMGVRCGLVGTNQSEIADIQIPAKFTTPEAYDLAALLDRMHKSGCTHVVMEASSQALQQGRLSGLRFALGIFTNLTKDHLDYHGDMEAYFTAKRLLFLQCDAMLVNAEDPYGQRLLFDAVLSGEGGLLREVKTYLAEDTTADFAAQQLLLSAGGVRFAFLGEEFLQPVSFAMPGRYNVENALAAGAAAVMLGYEPAAVGRALSQIKGVKGRSEVLYKGRFTVICDFAHTADAIDNLLATLRPFAQKRLVVLYGCAGMRERTKRPDMSRAVMRYADEIVLTADNPRKEPVSQTLDDAVGPLEEGGATYHVQADREAAVKLALGLLKEGDMLVLCGKGHEDYQVMDGYTLYFEERQIVEQWIQENQS